jgi:hypothetical protein
MFGGDGSDGFPIFTIYVRSKVGKVRFFVVYVCVCVCVCVCVLRIFTICVRRKLSKVRLRNPHA